MTKVPLSDVGAEQVRDLRARLNRVPKGALGDKSVGPLTKGFFDVCARVDLAPAASPAAVATPAALLEAAKAADVAGLQALVGALQKARADNPGRLARLVGCRRPAGDPHAAAGAGGSAAGAGMEF